VSASYTLCQYVRHGTSFTTRTLARKLKSIDIKASYKTIERHLLKCWLCEKTFQSDSYADQGIQAKTYGWVKKSY